MTHPRFNYPQSCVDGVCHTPGTPTSKPTGFYSPRMTTRVEWSC